MTPKFKFEIFNDTLYPTGIEVIAPIGWDECSMGVDRDPDFFSLIEIFEGSFLWFGNARDAILAIESDQGADAIATIKIAISYGDAFENIFTGLLDISQLQEIDFHDLGYKVDVPIIRDDFWAKFTNRYKTAVNVKSTTDLDGNARTVLATTVLTLTGQKINQLRLSQTAATSLDPDAQLDQFTLAPLQYAALDVFTVATVDEIEEWLSPGTNVVDSNALVPPQIGMRWDGVYSFDIAIYLWGTLSQYFIDPAIEIFLQVNNNAPQYFAKGNFGLTHVNGYTRGLLSYTVTMKAGDTVRIGVYNSSPVFTSTITVPAVASLIGSLTINGVTSYKNTVCDSMLIHRTFRSVLDRIIGRNNTFYSEFFGRASDGYDNTGCGAANALMLGQHLRNYAFSEKPFSISADDLWSGANPIFNLGLTYEVIGGVKKIRIEPKEYFLSSSISVTFNYVRNLKRRWDLDYFFKTFETGYANWSAESASGIDDPQTVVRRYSRFKTIGIDFSALSTWFAASLGIEQTRRQQALKSTTDWKLDNNIVIIAVNKTTFNKPELTENFDAVANLQNSTTRYNIRLSATRLFKRWQSFFAGCLQIGTRKDFYFADGEGNNTMSSTLKASDCEGDGIALVENQDIVNDGAYLFTPGVYEFNVPLTKTQYSAIIADRQKSIAISKTNADHETCIIKSMRWQPTKGEANFIVLIKSAA